MMHIYDLIVRKKRGEALSRDELDYIVSGAVRGDIPDYQLAAFLAAVCFQGMTVQETADLTLSMAHSGDMADLSDIPGVKADKHSTGGVGDKTTLAVAPIAAACGLVMAKMSGRGLGHTGGTVDKLESIPGFRTALDSAEFRAIVRKTGLCIAGQSGNLAPADKKLYALRDVTATVDSMPLIASSIMSKKLAAGADVILLDVKYGSGAFLSAPKDAVELAELMVGIGTAAGRRTAALITDMDVPLGAAIGNSLEVREAVETPARTRPGGLHARLACARGVAFVARRARDAGGLPPHGGGRRAKRRGLRKASRDGRGAGRRSRVSRRSLPLPARGACGARRRARRRIFAADGHGGNRPCLRHARRGTRTRGRTHRPRGGHRADAQDGRLCPAGRRVGLSAHERARRAPRGTGRLPRGADVWGRPRPRPARRSMLM